MPQLAQDVQKEPDEHELKFAIDRVLTSAAGAFLAGLFRPDPAFPDNVVATLYFDTRELSSLADCRDGVLVKNKLRLRWYEDESGRPSEEPGVLEIKRRFGSRRRKERWVTAIDGPWLASLPTVLPAAVPGLFDELAAAPFAHGVPRGGVSPALLVRYRRRRFVDSASGSRLSLDTDIRACAIRSGSPTGGLGRRLRASVIEVKNTLGTPPPTLRPFLGRLTRAISFSKYERCFAAALDPAA